jgi:hypothetical protein
VLFSPKTKKEKKGNRDQTKKKKRGPNEKKRKGDQTKKKERKKKNKMPPKKRQAHEAKAQKDLMDFSVSVSPETGPPPTPESVEAAESAESVEARSDAKRSEERSEERTEERIEKTGLASIAASLSRIETTLGSMERALDAVRGVCAVNAELVAANVALRASASSLYSTGATGPMAPMAPASSLCSAPTGPMAPMAPMAPTGPMAPTSKVVSYIVGATDVALVGNDHTFEMRAALKASNAKWTTSAQPARWVVSQEAWAERRAEWEATFGVSFVERAS